MQDSKRWLPPQVLLASATASHAQTNTIASSSMVIQLTVQGAAGNTSSDTVRVTFRQHCIAKPLGAFTMQRIALCLFAVLALGANTARAAFPQATCSSTPTFEPRFAVVGKQTR